MEGSLRLWSSNRLEVLCDRLAALMRDEPQDALSPEVVVVQNRGMERWLRLELARPGRLGVCANVRFPFPNRFLADVTEALFPGRYDIGPFERDALSWRILRLLAGERREGLEPLAAYLDRDRADEARLYDLAWTVASHLDQYVVYRPDMVLGWEAGEGDDWQAELWRALLGDLALPGASALRAGGQGGGRTGGQDREVVHRARLRMALLAALARDGGEDGDRALGFERVCVFGVSVLPPFHLSVLEALSRRVAVELFLLNPSREYWSLAASPRRKARLLRAVAEAHPERPAPSAEDQALETGNALLASLGRLGKDFFDAVIACDPVDEPDFVDPLEGGASALRLIQSDILSMVERGDASGDPRAVAAAEIDAADASLTFHSCHSPMREAEVLHDFLLDCFRRTPELRPGDVLVMSPDIETYGPAIQAVFEAAEEPAQRIPIAVADRSVLAQGSLARTVERILSLPESRCSASELLALLGDGRVRARFEMSQGDSETVAGWLSDAGIRWGLDAAHRQEIGLPAERQNTWEAGLERLILGFAMAGPAGGSQGLSDAALYRGILPTDGPEGSEAGLLGRLVDLTQAVREARALLAARRALEEWPEAVREALHLLVAPDPEGEDEEWERLDTVLRELASSARLGSGHALSGQAALFGVGAFRAALSRRLGDERASGRFLTGRVTVCRMEPMRSIPARVICLVGMNASLFPTRERAQGFDLMARRPRPGDRSRVDEDRYLFLETLLSARSALYVSWVGQSIQDNKEIAPAVPVSLLLDYAEQAFGGQGRGVRERLVVRHPLQPWSARYLAGGDARDYTYSRRNTLAAAALASGPGAPRRLCERPLGPAEGLSRDVELEELIRFLANPSRHFVSRRLGFTLRTDAETVEDREPFLLEGLDRYRVEQELLDALLRGGGVSAALESAGRALRAAGRLPHGSIGELQLEKAAAEVAQFVRRLEERRAAQAFAPCPVSVQIEGITLRALLPPRYGNSLVEFRWGKLRAVDRIRAWLTHLAACASGALSGEWSSVFLAGDRSVETGFVEEARERLAEVLRLRAEGLTRPVPFFPETSLAYADASLGGDPRRALGRARGAWDGYAAAESEDPYFHLCFGDDEDPLGEEFQGLALAVLAPCLDAQRLGAKGS